MNYQFNPQQIQSSAPLINPNFIHHPSFGQPMFSFESPIKNQFNSSLSYGNIADPYMNDTIQMSNI